MKNNNEISLLYFPITILIPGISGFRTRDSFGFFTRYLDPDLLDVWNLAHGIFSVFSNPDPDPGDSEIFESFQNCIF